ncbi:hypothetical protein Clacol_008707 [Clathrus columnatus]|uniref:ABC transporter domain-containing protein n=1 Tax=Clathrus columnatus TaxID=1419009 RepID=A0AAV5AP39_9AGAM|nr:hypothetical protein Clacol_008707 [Clathrus columnatus]
MSFDKYNLTHATSQQTRFNIVDDTNSKDIDLHGVNVSIGKLDILVDAHLKLTTGMHYVLVGRNGVGKSTLLRSIYDKIIPGLSKTLRILLLQQNYYEDNITQEEWDLSALDYVVKSDRVRTEAIRRSTTIIDRGTLVLREVLEKQSDPTVIAKAVRQLKHETRMEELAERMKMATLRSGARGLKARKELKALEEEVEEEKAKLVVVTEDDLKVGREIDEAVTMLSELDNALENMSASTSEVRAEALLLGLGFSKNSIRKPMATLSGGWRMRTMLASVLFQPCDIMLLDEPTNFLDMASLLWLENHLKESSKTTILLVSHDRTFADAIAEEIIVLRDKKLERFPGNLTAYEEVREENRQRLTKMKEAQGRQKAHMEQTIAGNIRAAKATGDDKKLKQAASRQKKLDERMGYEVGMRGGKFKLNRDLPGYHTTMRAEIEIPEDDAAAKMALPQIPLSELQFPGPLVSCDKVTVGYIKKDNPSMMTVVLQNISFTIHMHDRVALIGLNGAGKSTLVSVLVNQTSSDIHVQGSIQHHPRARIGYFSQTAVDMLPADTTALQYLAGREEPLHNAEEQELRKKLASLGLSGKTVSDLPLSRLSGGQKVRVALSKILHPPPHLLILDEVTTHLDADSILILTDELRKYEGAVLLVSHDRWFVKKVVEEESENEDEKKREGVNKVYMVGKGHVEELVTGIDEFEKRVRKKLKEK